MAVYMGIDPGAKGAFAIIDDEDHASVFDASRPDDMLAHWVGQIALAVIEDVHAMPDQGVSSAFTFGMEVGEWVGWLRAKGIPFEWVTPRRWQRGVLDKVPVGKKQIKNYVCDYACRRWPQLELRGSRGGIKDGRSDAVCMAAYARYRVNGRL